jgi:hypothetical protein
MKHVDFEEIKEDQEEEKFDYESLNKNRIK